MVSVYQTSKPKQILITGASGLVGTALSKHLALSNYQTAAWNRRAERDQGMLFDAADAVVHLAGDNIAGSRWTASKKKKIIKSRVDFTRALANQILKRPHRPPVFISASAIGYYGDRGDEVVDEASLAGEGFLADLCQAWEAETRPLADAKIRVVNLRIGMVLAKEGGALRKMLPAFKMGLGGPLGEGHQSMSWIAVTDLVRLIQFLLENEKISGAVNAVSPNPVTNLEFSKTLAETLHRPLGPRVPAFVLRLALGEMAEELLLASTRVEPKVAVTAGFRFEFSKLGPALRSILS